MKGELEPTELPLIKHWPHKRLWDRVREEDGNYCRGLQLRDVYPITPYEDGLRHVGQEVKLEKKNDHHEMDILLKAAASISPAQDKENAGPSTAPDDDDNFVTLRLRIPVDLPKDSDIKKMGYTVSFPFFFIFYVIFLTYDVMVLNYFVEFN